MARRASIGLTRGLWHDHERYLDSYWRDIQGVWRHGDWAVRDEDGFWFVLGRSDDTLKIAGKRTGPSEIEAAAIGVTDPIKGEAVGCVVVMAPDLPRTRNMKVMRRRVIGRHVLARKSGSSGRAA